MVYKNTKTRRPDYNRMPNKGRRVMAAEETEVEDVASVDVAPEATDLLFEATDVAEIIAEVTGEPVEVTAEDMQVTFAVGDDEIVVEADGGEEILESTRRTFRNKRPVTANARNRNTTVRPNTMNRKPASRVTASTNKRMPTARNGRTLRTYGR